MTVNLCHDAQRRTKREALEPIESITERATSAENPEQQLEGERRRQLLHEGLGVF